MLKSNSNFSNKITQSLQSGKMKEWAKLVSITGGAQMLIQALGLLSGIVVVRLLPTEEYAFYTLANTMLGVMTVLTDSGIGAGVMAEGGKVWKDHDKMGSVLNTGLDLRKKFAVGSLVLSSPILIYLLHHHGAGFWMSVIIVASLIPALIGSLTGSIFMIPMKLNQDLKPLQANLVVENIGRFVFVLSLFLLPWTFIAILASGIPRVYMNIRLKKLSVGYVNWKAPLNAEVRKNVMAIVKRIMPGALYYCVSGQVSIWLISIFGTTANVAEIGALGRIAMVLTVVSTLFGMIVYPRYTRLPAKTGLLIRRFIQINLALSLICTFIILLVHFFSDEVLWVLGDQYANLNYALVLCIIGACVRLVSGAMFKLNSHRGWAVHPGLSIPVSILGIVLGAIIVDVSTLEGILLFNIFVAVIQLIMNLAYFAFEVFRMKKTELIS